MISLDTMFWMSLLLFGVIGMMRGWTKEVVATAGMVLSLFAQLWFGHHLVALFSSTGPTPEDVRRAQFFVRSIFHVLFAFFAYQGPTVARQVSGGRFGQRARSSIQESGTL